MPGAFSNATDSLGAAHGHSQTGKIFSAGWADRRPEDASNIS
jgi:hypothetical protein